MLMNDVVKYGCGCLCAFVLTLVVGTTYTSKGENVSFAGFDDVLVFDSCQMTGPDEAAQQVRPSRKGSYGKSSRRKGDYSKPSHRKGRDFMRSSRQTVRNRILTPEDAYHNGYANGYNKGLYDGRHAFWHGKGYDDSNRFDDYYAMCYEEGYDEGYDEGYEIGYASARADYYDDVEEDLEDLEDVLDW